MSNYKTWLANIGWVVLEIVVFTVMSGILLLIFNLLFTQLGWLQPDTSLSENFSRPYRLLLVEYLPLLLIVTFTTYLTHTLIFKFPFSQTGIQSDNILPQFGWGWLIGTSIVTIGFLVLFSFKLIEFRSFNWNAWLLLGFLLFFIVQSAGEEVIMRGFLLPAIEARFGTVVALILSSSVFAIAHYFNPNANWIGITNIFLGGLLMGILFIQFRNIWTPIGLHASWNFIQASFFDFEVSGFDVYSLIQFEETGMDIMTGGDFGYEGSIISVAFLIITIGLLLSQNWKSLELFTKKASELDN